MSKTKSPPGHEQVTIEGLKAEWVSLAQRCTQMEARLQKGIDENGTCLSVVVVIAIAAILIGIANAWYLIAKEWTQCPPT